MTKLQRAEQLRRVVQMFAASLPTAQAIEVATIYDAWEPGKRYKKGVYLTHGEDENGDPKLYEVAQLHTSQADREPGAGTESLYTAISLDENGRPIWAPPTGAQDAYDTGDIVSHNGVLYISNIDGNTTEPGTDERWWSIYNE